MSKKDKKAAEKASFRQKIRPFLPLCGVVALLIAGACLPLLFRERTDPNVAAYKEKLALLEAAALTEETRAVLGKNPAGEQAGYAVFLSVCDTTERASVFCGAELDLHSAWKAADAKATEFLSGSWYHPVWVKADVVCVSDTLGAEEFSWKVSGAQEEFYRWGVAFDPYFDTALLEAELNGAAIYDYDGGSGVDWKRLNAYLIDAGRTPLDGLSGTYTVFQCLGWLCDEDGAVYALSSGGLDYGRRTVTVDGDYALELILNASAFLEAQIRGDGSFIYGIYPGFDMEIDSYNIVRHAGTLWSLICRYRLAPDEALAEEIDRVIGFMLDSVVYDPAGRAYLYEKGNDEIDLGGSSLAVVALTEYMDALGNEKYADVCRALGEGILTMLDQNTGEYYHILNRDFTRKEAMRVIFYDGEATFALCRLYGLTGDPVWLNAARSAVDHFLAEDYTRYGDHWVAYSMNEITKYITDNRAYYDFALANAQNNLGYMLSREVIHPTHRELLMATFEVYDRMTENGISADGFDPQAFLNAISTLIDRSMDGYFYPEYAMYMENPRRILNTFMVRNDWYRVRIDDVQHNIGGLYLYCKNYDKLVNYGMPAAGAADPD